jgi:peptide/nickel transport system substrate-binding protein
VRISDKIGWMAILGIALVLVLAGCGKGAMTSTSETTANMPIATTTTTSTTLAPKPATTTTAPAISAAVPTGDLRLGLSSFGTSGQFDPVIVQNAGSNCAPMFDDMITLDQNGILAPSVVDRWQVSADGKSWTYYVHQGIKFQNGDNLTAADVKMSLERYAGKDAFLAPLRDTIDHVDMIDNYTVRIYTKAVSPFFPNMTAAISGSQSLVQPKNYIDQNGAAYFSAHPIGSGAYTFVRYAGGDNVQYEANATYWGGVPGFKNLTIYQVPEAGTRIAMLKTGAIEACDIALSDVPGLESAGLKTMTADTIEPRLYLMGTYYPSAKGVQPTADIRVRKALNMAINREEINKNFFYGKATLPWVSGVGAYLNDVDLTYWAKYAADYYKYDPVQATQLLADAGYSKGFSIKIYSSADENAPYLNDLSQVIQGYWKAIGVNAQIIVLDRTALNPLRKAPAPELIGQVIATRNTSSPQATARIRDGMGNDGNYRLFSSSPTETAMPLVDTLLNQIDSEPDAAKRMPLLAQLIDVTAQAYVSLQISQTPLVHGYSPNVQVPAGLAKPVVGLGWLAGRMQHATK